jgi:predicted ATP-binding protein involved in virulence
MSSTMRRVHCPRMLLRKLRLDNVKCFARGTEIDFTVGKQTGEDPHRWIVVYGSNGLGKSTLLRSIAIALTGQPAMNFLLPTAEGWVRGTNKTASVGVEISRNDAPKGLGDAMTGQRKKPLALSWTLVGRRATTFEGRAIPSGSIVLDEEADYKLFQSYIATDDGQRGWLLCGYGPHRRLTGASSDITEKVSPHGRAARLMTLFHEKAALTSAERWLIELDHAAQKSGDTRRLDAVRQILDRNLLHGGVTLGEINPEEVLFRTPFSADVPMADLSDGYRTWLALALDLLRHVSYCFDIEKLLEVGDDHICVNAEGIVLIDEIDSHLHPEWQRIIGDWLHRTFPRIQFIVATHSPLIPERISRDDGMVVRLMRRTQGKGDVVDAECERSTERSLTADQNLTSRNFGLTSTRDVLIDSLLAKIEALTRRVRIHKASQDERDELRRAQVELDLTAPPISGSGDDALSPAAPALEVIE